MAAPTRSAELLDRIAAALSVPVEAFGEPAQSTMSDTAAGAHIAAMLFDPHGRQVAASWPHLSPQARKAFADTIAAYVQQSLPQRTEGRR